MRYKFVILFVFLIIFNEIYCNGVQGPPTDKKKKDDKTGEYISQVNNVEGEEVSALKIVSAPDLSKERDRRKGDGSKEDDAAESVDLSMLKQAKWLQKMVQEIGGFQYTIVSNDQEITGTIDEEEPPPVLEPLAPKELTPEEIEGNSCPSFIPLV